jgi:Tfp pilus assembly protein PilO
MDIVHAMGDLIECLGIFGGIGLIILASNKAKIDKMRAEREIMRQSLSPRGETSTDLQELKQQISEMQSTSHQFDISFDAALSRLEERVSRVETKVAAAPMSAPQSEEVQGIGLR